MRTWLAAAALLIASRARADEPDPAAPPPAAPPAEASKPPEPAPPSTAGASQSDAELTRMAEEQRRQAELATNGILGEDTIEIFDQRPKKPFDRDTDLRLTGEQLAARGATDLGSALRLLPDVTVRDAGRGGFNIDVRGGRKGAVSILIDGVSVTDPYYGTFDVSTIPITDIVQIRVSTNPQSPIDGPGGPGGVVEVVTRDAIGPQLVIGRIAGDSLPSVGATAMARIPLAKRLALRLSAGGLLGSHEHPMPGNLTLDEERRTATGATRLEYRDGERRAVLDGFIDTRHYVSPPSDTEKGDIVLIDRETSARASTKIDDRIGELQLQGQAWMHYLARRSRHFTDPAMETQSAFEDLSATRIGGLALATRAIGRDARWATSATINREQADVEDTAGNTSRGDATVIELAGDLQYELKGLRLDGAAGVAIPIGLGADPWPEAKLVARYKPVPGLELVATGGRKGRLPSLRERFALDTGNPALGPEKAWHSELRAIETRDRFKIEVAPFYRRTTGTIRLLPDPLPEDPTHQRSSNLGELTLLGVDTSAQVEVHRIVEIGASYGYIRARSDAEDPALAMAPLDRLPSHRFDTWARVTPIEELSVLARIRYLGASYDKAELIDGYATVEATATSPITKHYLAVLRVEDVTNVAPETRKGYHTPGRIISLIVQGSWE